MALTPWSSTWAYSDGGRAAAGYKGVTGDCVCRAIALATEIPYQDVYEMINVFGKSERRRPPKRPGERRRVAERSSARTGVYPRTCRRIMEYLGWEWTPTMAIGKGCTVHLRADELPKGRLVVSVSKHLVAVVDGVILDVVDPSRCGTRCVYGYWRAS